MKEFNIYLVRHGQSQANVDETIYKEIPDHSISLTERGTEQALEAGKIFNSFIDGKKLHCYYSPYQRTLETMNLMLSSFNDEQILSKVNDIKLREIEYGTFDGLTEKERQKLFPHEYALHKRQENFEGRYFTRLPNGESYADVALRAALFISDLKTRISSHMNSDNYNEDTNNVAIFSHCVWIRCFVTEILSEHYSWSSKDGHMNNCSVRKISISENKKSINPFSEQSIILNDKVYNVEDCGNIFDGYPM